MLYAEIKEFLDVESTWAESEPDPEAVSAAMNVFDNSVVKPAFKKPVLEN